MSKMPWFRLYSESLNDRKLRRVARQTSQPWALVFGSWVGLLCLANESPERGQILIGSDLPMEHDEIAEALRLDMSTYRTLIQAFVEARMVDDGLPVTICKWSERQFKSDNVTARVQRFRAKKAKKSETLQERSNETLHERYRTDTDKNKSKNRSAANGAGPNGEVAGPFADDQYTHMLAAVSSVVKETYVDHVNGNEFNSTVDALTEKGITPEQVKAFADWWKANGFYNGKPALKSLIAEIGNSVSASKSATPTLAQRINDAWRDYGPAFDRWPADLRDAAAAQDWRDHNLAIFNIVQAVRS